MNDTDRTLLRIERLLTRIADRLAPVDKPKSEAVMVTDGGDVPSQLESTMVRRGDRYHRVTRIKGDR